MQPSPLCIPIDALFSLFHHACLLDENLSVVWISPQMAREMGIDPAEAPGQIVQGIDPGLSPLLQKALRDGDRASYTLRDGARPLPLEIVPVPSPAGKRLFLYVENLFPLQARLERERDERVKELKCIYLLGKEMERAKTLDDLLASVSGHINDAMQYPGVCSTSIHLHGREYSSLPRESPVTSSIETPINVRGEKRGRIQVCLHGSQEFLKEEAELITSISKMLGRAAERFELARKRLEYTQSLEAMVEERVKELEESRRRYKDLFDNAPTGISISTRDGKMIAANRAFFRMLKYSQEDQAQAHIIKDNLYRNPADRENLLKLVEETGRAGEVEFDLNARDGSVITVSCSTRMFEEYGVTYYESILRNITEKKILEKRLRQQTEILELKVKKRTEVLERQKDKLMEMNRQCKATSAELRSSINKMQALFNAITDPVVSIDRDFNIQMTNRAPDNVGQKCHQVHFHNDTPCRKCPAIRAIDRKKPASIEVQTDDRFYLVQCYPVFDPQGSVEGVIEWIKDITADKSICEQMLQQDRLASLGQLVSGIGHEINNPNTFILGNMKIIHEALQDILPVLDEHNASHPGFKIARLDYSFFREHIRLLVDDMLSGAERIKTIVQDLKKFARKGEDRFDTDVSINQLVSRSIRMVQNQVKRKAAIHTSLDENLPPIRANPTGLEQVIVNLIMNAYEALDEGEKGNIHITTSLDEQGENVILKVSDDGMGMDKETLAQIFNPFFTTKRNKGGTGLGLSILYRIVKEHGGEIDVESTPGTGTTFILELPPT